mgnify:CR=1 FL=1
MYFSPAPNSSKLKTLSIIAIHLREKDKIVYFLFIALTRKAERERDSRFMCEEVFLVTRRTERKPETRGLGGQKDVRMGFLGRTERWAQV